MKSIKEQKLGGKPVRGAPPKPAPKKPPSPPPAHQVVAVVKDKGTGKPLAQAKWDLVKKGAEGKVLAAGTTPFQGTLSAAVPGPGSYLVRVRAVAGRPAPAKGAVMGQGAAPARPKTQKASPTPVLVKVPPPSKKKPAAGNKKPAAKKAADLHIKNLELALKKS